MANAPARVHGKKSNRATATKGGSRKEVFKSVLSNPYEVQWYVMGKFLFDHYAKVRCDAGEM
jgi:hypothetical protein